MPMRYLLSRRFRQIWHKSICLGLIVSMLAGCAGTERSLSYFGGEKELQYYEDASTRIEYPEVATAPNENVLTGQAPRDLTSQKKEQVWQLSLAEALHLALTNNKIVRTRGDFLGGSSLYSNPDGVASVWDSAIKDSGVLFGGRGVESALAQFDTQWTTSMVWGGTQTVSNNPFASGGVSEGAIFQQDSANFSTGLQKSFMYGATGSITQNWNYSKNDTPRLFPSAYDGNLVFNYTQPLWAGAGTEYTRIAGPASSNIQGLSGVNQGVVIARINTDISLVDFEIQVKNMLRDVEDTYWDLYLAYRRFHSVVTARDSNLQTWRDEQAKLAAGAGAPADEAQAREAYFNARAEAENALGGEDVGIYNLELQLRRLCGLPSNDGRIIQPKDEPTSALVLPEWHASLAEALARREELRRQKWNIKSLELQLIASENIANPRFDFVASYQLNGFGDDLFGNNTSNTGSGAFQSAYAAQFRGQQTGYGVGFNFSVPIGLRNVKAQVQNVELRLAKAREVIAIQEQEVSHELTNAFQNLRWRYQTSQTNFNRRVAAEKQVNVRRHQYEAGVGTLDLLLRAQTALATADIGYYTSLIGYNKAITELHYRKGTLLENDNVSLAEGAWTPEAMKDAYRRAWARTYAFDAPSADPVHHEPEPFATNATLDATSSEVIPAGGQVLPEEIQMRPQPTPAGADVPLAPPRAPGVPTPVPAGPDLPPNSAQRYQRPPRRNSKVVPASRTRSANKQADAISNLDNLEY